MEVNNNIQFMNKFAEILKQVDENVINEETAKAITEAFESAVEEKVSSRVSLELESALAKQDTDHAEKLKNLLEAIDKDHTEKLQNVVSAITENHTSKLKNVIKFYRKAINEKANKFSEKVVSEISNYLDLYLNSKIPNLQLKEAVENTYARKQLEKIRHLIGLDPEYINESVKTVVSEGKKTIDELNEKLNEAYKQNELLSEKLKVNETAILLEKKTKGMPVAKKEFITNLLNDKDASYINENFNYVVEMFERGEEEKSSELVEEAKRGAVSKNVKIPAQTAVIAESKTEKVDGSPVNGYLTELQRF
jgi:uncharacterized protein with PIN domain